MLLVLRYEVSKNYFSHRSLLNEPTTYGTNIVSKRKLFGRINPEAYAEDFEEIFKCLGEGSVIALTP